MASMYPARSFILMSFSATFGIFKGKTVSVEPQRHLKLPKQGRQDWWDAGQLLPVLLRRDAQP